MLIRCFIDSLRCIVACPSWKLASPLACFIGFGLLVANSHSAQSPKDDPFDGFSELSDAGDLLAEDEGMRRVAAQQLESQVKSELSHARKSRDPSATKLSLKSLQDQIRRATELDPSGRSRLESQVSSEIGRAHV